MVAIRGCVFRSPEGKFCQAPPLRDSNYCLMHSPEHAEEVKEARRLGGLRRKREATVLGAYDFSGLDTLEGIIRLLQLVAIDTLGMENSASRNRTLIYLSMVALKALEVGNLEERIKSLEQAVESNKIEGSASVFDLKTEAMNIRQRESS
jgi:hypothetical protein